MGGVYVYPPAAAHNIPTSYPATLPYDRMATFGVPMPPAYPNPTLTFGQPIAAASTVKTTIYCMTITYKLTACVRVHTFNVRQLQILCTGRLHTAQQHVALCAVVISNIILAFKNQLFDDSYNCANHNNLLSCNRSDRCIQGT